MSLLPQRKKSSEEIAKLCESLGIPGDLSADEEISAGEELEVIAEIPADEPEQETIPDAISSPPAPEQVPVLRPEAPEPMPEVPANAPKPVRSLRKSERTPSSVGTRKVAVSSPNSKIPARRHTDQDIEEIRRREALGTLQSPNTPAVYFQSLLAHRALVITGYLLALAGAVCAFFDTNIAVVIACEALALGIAGYICLNKKLSRHHSAFIFIVALLVIIFGALYYFPHLRNAP